VGFLGGFFVFFWVGFFGLVFYCQPCTQAALATTQAALATTQAARATTQAALATTSPARPITHRRPTRIGSLRSRLRVIMHDARRSGWTPCLQPLDKVIFKKFASVTGVGDP
jgi:hypothetical protein